jgi:hypothetical protein
VLWQNADILNVKAGGISVYLRLPYRGEPNRIEVLSKPQQYVTCILLSLLETLASEVLRTGRLSTSGEFLSTFYQKLLIIT